MSLKRSIFKASDVEVVEKKSLYEGFFTMLSYKVRHRLFNGGWSETIERELFQRGEAAAALVYDPKHDLIGLVEQFRIGALASSFGPWCLEVVAGMVEPQESVEDLIRREIREEAGLENVQLLPICSYYSTPGGCSEKIHLFCALTDLQNTGGIYGVESENEDIRFQVYQPKKVFDHMLHGRTNNAATLIGLQWLQLNIDQLREKYSGEAF